MTALQRGKRHPFADVFPCRCKWLCAPGRCFEQERIDAKRRQVQRRVTFENADDEKCVREIIAAAVSEETP